MSFDGFFEKYFGLLSGDGSFRAYPWQEELFRRIIGDNWPDSVALPTGAGKTSILKIWLLAFGWGLLNGKAGAVPRRLAWVVNRRVVVDQATREAESMADILQKLGRGDDLAAALLDCSVEHKQPLAISTLRGQKADNRRWSEDPLAPAVVIGTVDMIGSRLLFRGYRDGKYFRPYHAGLLGVDTLLVNDESHLTPAFAELLKAIADMRSADTVGKQFRVLFVSATERGIGSRPFDHDIGIDAKESARFGRVYEAEKRAYLHEAADVDAKIFELATTEPSVDRTIIFIDKPENALAFAERLRKQDGDGNRVRLLTGTMRGFERDGLSNDETFKKFQERTAVSDGPYYLVSTSAGEVGVDISAERLLTPLRESDVLIQRLGRLNRFGDPDGEPHRVGEAHIVFSSKKLSEGDEEDQTLEYLRHLAQGGSGAADVSCRSLRADPPSDRTRSKSPLTAKLDERLIDLWSQTSAPCSKASAMPFVEHWLYGKRDDVFETELAWRKEVEFLALPGVSQTDREAALERYRVLPQETLKEPTYRLRDKLLAFPASRQDERLLFQSSDGAVHACTIGELADDSKWTDYDLADGVVLLPVGCGWLSHGMLRAKEADGKAGDDIADFHDEGDSEGEAACRCRYLAERDEGVWSVGILGGPDRADGLADWKNGLDRKGGRLLKVSLPREDEEGRERFLIFQTNIGQSNRAAKKEDVVLKTHLEDVEAKARQIARLTLPGHEEAFGLAGVMHDVGKGCPLWQKAMGGDLEVPLAKTKRPANPKLLKGYRHELRSLLTALENSPTDDLFLHLVASHHGWARPYWEKTAYDKDRSTEENARAAMEAARRFSRLQDEWGPWGLAYLEALFKAADGMASRQEEGVSDG